MEALCSYNFKENDQNLMERKVYITFDIPCAQVHHQVSEFPQFGHFADGS